MKILKTSTPLRVDTIATPYTVLLEISSSQPTGQYKIGNDYSDDRSVVTPVLTPVLHLGNVDDGSSFIGTMTDVKWYLVLNLERAVDSGTDDEALTKGCIQITNSTTGFSLSSDGQILTVTKNGGFRVRCVVKYADATGIEMATTQDIEFGCDDVADAQFRMFIQGAVRHWDPLKARGSNTSQAMFTEGESRQKFVAKAYLGPSPVPASLNPVYQWGFEDVEAGVSYADITEDDALCAAYVSGQGTNTLVLDADYTDGIKLYCTLLVGGQQVAQAKGVLNIRLPRNLNMEIRGARNIRNNNDNLVYSAKARIGNKEVDETAAKNRIVTVWSRRTAAAAEVTVHSTLLQVKAKDLANTTAGARVSAAAGVLSALLPLVDSSGKVIVDGSGNVVCGRA